MNMRLAEVRLSLTTVGNVAISEMDSSDGTLLTTPSARTLLLLVAMV